MGEDPPNELPINEIDQTTETETDETSFQYPPLFSSKTLIELCISSWSRTNRARQDVQPYLRGCKWSPDGTCCLTVVNNDGVHVTELPRDLYSGNVCSDRTTDVLDSVIHIKEAGLVYDLCWYPHMNSAVPETCCWLTTRQNAPVQLWDGFDGLLRSSYRGYNAVDEMEPALCVTFNPEGNAIIAGYKKALRTFEVEKPGRDFLEHKINSPASCLVTGQYLLAVGSWNSSITLYSMSEFGTFKSIGKMHGHSGGVTHMKFTPNGQKLVSGSRKDSKLLIWDIRYYSRPLNILSREVNTNQRIYFDISPCGKYLVTGGTDGVVKVWDVNKVNWHEKLDVIDNDHSATFRFPLHNDCCNSISVHPLRPILATGSGQYHSIDPIESTEDNIKKEFENSDVMLYEEPNVKSSVENTLVFWWIGDIPDIT